MKKKKNRRYRVIKDTRIFYDRHHLIPRSRYKAFTGTMKGHKEQWNLLYIRRDRHEAWHKLFHNWTIEEVLRVLRGLPSVQVSCHPWQKLFGNKTCIEAYRLLARVRRAKLNQRDYPLPYEDFIIS